MIDYNTLLAVERVNRMADALGFVLACANYSSNLISLRAKDNEYPLFSRDADLYRGSLEEIEIFLEGMQFQLRYDQMLNLYTKNKRLRTEQNVRNERLMQTLAE